MSGLEARRLTHIYLALMLLKEWSLKEKSHSRTDGTQGDKRRGEGKERKRRGEHEDEPSQSKRRRGSEERRE